MCEPGNYVTESKCVECEKNTYGSGVSDSCTACPGDLVSDAGSSSVDDCKVGKGLLNQNMLSCLSVRQYLSIFVFFFASICRA